MTPAAVPRRRLSVRLRLTALYGVLFLASGAVLLGITYLLVDHATQDEPVSVVLPNGQAVSVMGSQGDPPAGPGTEGSRADPQAEGTSNAPAPDPDRVAALAARQHHDRMTTLLTRSGIALGATAVLSMVLGWVVAGRVLRPVRTITTATRRIGASNLHERLALAGPRDELTELGDTIDDLLARLDQSFESQRRFVANASHELRTPLARQRTVAQVALDDPDASVESLRAAHERVLAAGAGQERLIEALLDLAHGQAGIISTDDVDLADIAQRVLDVRAEQLPNAQLTLQTNLAPAHVRGDGRLLERLVANLVDNAVRHNHPEGRVQIATSGWRLSVANSGTHIPPERVDRLLQPFQRLAGDRTGAGIGLGLSIVQAIADAHHATLTVAARSEGGLAIDVEFPPPSG